MLMYSEQYSLNQNKEHRWVLANSDIYFPIWNSHKLAELVNLDYKKYNVVLTRYNRTDNYTPEQKKIYTGYKFRYDDVEYTTMWGGEQLVDPHTGLTGLYEGTSIDSWFYTTPLDFEISDSYSTGNDDVQWEDWHPAIGGHRKTLNKNINLDIEIGRDACDQMVNYELSKKKILINPCLNVVSIHEHANWSENTGAYVDIKYRGKTYTREEYKHMMINDRNFRWGSVPFT
jgi:hypothetical protein